MIYDEQGNIISNPDLSKGYLMSKTRVKSDAEPIDNINKFAWFDSDYEEIQIYIPKLEPAHNPSPDEDRDAMLVDMEYRLTLLELGLQEV